MFKYFLLSSPKSSFTLHIPIFSFYYYAAYEISESFLSSVLVKIGWNSAFLFAAIVGSNDVIILRWEKFYEFCDYSWEIFSFDNLTLSCLRLFKLSKVWLISSSSPYNFKFLYLFNLLEGSNGIRFNFLLKEVLFYFIL